METRERRDLRAAVMDLKILSRTLARPVDKEALGLVILQLEELLRQRREGTVDVQTEDPLPGQLELLGNQSTTK